VLIWFRITLTTFKAKITNIFVFVKVMPETLLVPFFGTQCGMITFGNLVTEASNKVLVLVLVLKKVLFTSLLVTSFYFGSINATSAHLQFSLHYPKMHSAIWLVVRLIILIQLCSILNAEARTEPHCGFSPSAWFCLELNSRHLVGLHESLLLSWVSAITQPPFHRFFLILCPRMLSQFWVLLVP